MTTNHGGRRVGAGKPTKRITLDEDVWKRLHAMGVRGKSQVNVFVNAALMAALDEDEKGQANAQ